MCDTHDKTHANFCWALRDKKTGEIVTLYGDKAHRVLLMSTRRHARIVARIYRITNGLETRPIKVLSIVEEVRHA